MPVAILYCDVVATRRFDSHNCVAKKVNKQVEAKFRNLRIKEQKSRGTAKKLGNKLGRSPIPADALVDIYNP